MIWNKIEVLLGTPWELEKHIENSMVQRWEQIVNNRNPRTPPNFPHKKQYEIKIMCNMRF
jgi:hypothetical protein